MSQETEETAESAPTAYVRPWTYFLGGSTLLTVVAVVAAALLVQFLQKRPANLRSHTRDLARAFEETLEEQYVPSGNISRSGPEVRRGPKAIWNFYRYEVAMPSHLNPDGLKALVRESMQKQFVSVVDAPRGAPGRELTLALDEYEFAHVVFKTITPPPVLRSDLRAASHRIAEEVKHVLISAGIPPEKLRGEDPVDREDDESLWAVTRIRATLIDSLAPDDIRRQIENALIEHGVRVAGVEAAGDATLLRVAYAGRNCVEVLCRPASAAPENARVRAGTGLAVVLETQPAPEDALSPPALPSLDELPLDSIEHAAPDEGPLWRPELPKLPVPATGAKIAIILDDGGYGGPTTDQVLELDAGLTLAILPNTPFAAETARQAKEKGFEVILHMPMETHSKSVKPFPGQVTTDMNIARIQALVKQALDQVPDALGVNNHTGSKFTSSAEKMKAFLEVLKERSLYFVDSRTIASTVASTVAREMGVNTAERDIFLDNDEAPEKIRAQLAKLIEVAKAEGRAVGIGHFRENTVAVLAQELPNLAQQGVILVHASELVR